MSVTALIVRVPEAEPRRRPPCYACSTMHVEHSLLVRAPADRVYRIYQDVAHWHTWDPDTRQATLDGPFAVGSRGGLTPTKGNTVPMVLTKVEPDACFTVESRIPLFRMVFEHELVPQGRDVKVTHRVTFHGPLKFLLGRMLARQIDQGLPVTLARLKRLAESGTV